MLDGHGNNGGDGLEGVVRENLIGTYLHGPLLPKNAWLADELIARAIERAHRRPPRPGAARRRDSRTPRTRGARSAAARG